MHPVEILLSPLGKLLRNRHADPAAGLAAAPELATPHRITVTSPSFRDGDEIPAKHCGAFIGDDISPALGWSGLPDGTTAVVVIIDDLDVPTTVPGLHVIAEVAVSSSSPDGLPEGALALGTPGVEFLPNHRGRSGYVGPRPLPGHGPHHYRFHVLAVDVHLDLGGVADRAALPAAMAGHVLASGVLTGTRTS